MLKFQISLSRITILIILIAKVSTVPVELVPKVQTHPLIPEADLSPNSPQQYKYTLLPEGENRYRLRLDVESNRREETVELKSPGTPEEELFVKGSITSFEVKPQPGQSNVFQVTITYEAGKNGYRAKYVYSTATALFASAAFLKSAAG